MADNTLMPLRTEVRAPATDDLSNLQRLGNILAASGYFADAREMAQAAVKVMAGQELGIPPVAAMMGINIIKGKIALGAHLIASRIRAHGYDFFIVRQDDEGCVIQILSKPTINGKRTPMGVSSFTAADATAAGLGGDMYRKYPRNMYFSRAVSNAAKWYTPEIFGGAPVYTPEELGVEVDAEGDMVHRPDVAGIDTGGHPVGTQAAADHVRDRKISQGRRAQAAAKTSVPSSGEVAAPVQDPAAASPAAAESVTADVVAELWTAMGTKLPGILATFASLKATITELAGGDAPYYAVLAKHNMKHANDHAGGGLTRYRQCSRDLLLLVQKMQQEPEQEPIEPWEP
ncbi:MAG: hypothetical protein ACRDGM_02960 [bacterium]